MDGMKVGRRAFVKFFAGAIGGSLLTPIPWKLADDTAIWSQNWSWRPSPANGEITKVTTICGLCPGGCGIKASLVDKKRAIALQGNPDNPVNAGGICPLGASGLQFLYAPYRVTQPLKQTGKRGDPKGFRPISWEEALTELHSQLNRLRTEGKPYSLGCITGQSHSSMGDLWHQFFKAFGSPNLFFMPSAEDSLKTAAYVALGSSRAITFHLEQASYVLSFGAALAEGWGAPGRMQATFGRWRSGVPGTAPTKLVQVEPRCSLTAAKADQWIPIKPGSEAALALGLAHILLRDHLYDSEFIRNYSFGFDSWTDASGKSRQGFKDFVLANYTPDKVGELTGVTGATLTQLAKEFATQKQAVAVWGSGNGRTPNNFYHDLAFLALNALVGNLKPGGMLGVEPHIPLGTLPEIPAESAAEAGLRQPRLDLARHVTPPIRGNSVHSFLDAVNDNPAYPIELLLVHEANPAYGLAENRLFQTAAEKIGMLVSCSSYMDETATMADLILPNHMALERLDDVCGLLGAPYGYYAVTTPLLPPSLNTRHSGEVLCELAKKLGGGVQLALPWSKYQDYLQERIKGLAASGQGAVAERAVVEPWRLKPGEPTSTTLTVTEGEGGQGRQTPVAEPGKPKDRQDFWKKLSAGMFWYDAPANILEQLETASGRYEFAAQALLKQGMAAIDTDQMLLPQFRPLLPSGDEKEFPLQLMSYPLMILADQYLANPPFMTKLLPDNVLKELDMFVDINPETARGLGLNEADRATLRTPLGEITVRVHLSHSARPGVVWMPQGLGHGSYDEYIRNKGENGNKIMEVQIDPITGLGTVWATRAQLRRA
jgi:anaerobic selenocysteine-containing dehydrogenase